MVVRQKVGRKRYIAFEIVGCGEPLTRSKLTRTIGKKSNELGASFPFEVMFVTKERGIVRTDQKHPASLSAILNSFSIEVDGFKLKTISVSGTIRTLKEKYFRQGAP